MSFGSIFKTIDPRWLLLLIVVAVVCVYFPGLFGGYTFDDFPNLVDNTELHVSTLSFDRWWAAIFSSPSSELQRPLAMFTFAINYYFSGLDPFPVKLTNLIIHLLNVFLAFRLADIIFRTSMVRSEGTNPTPSTLALFVTALWALAPINLTPILLSVQRMESLAQVFVFIGLRLYIDGRLRQLSGSGGWGRIFLGIVICTGLGTLAKETATALPLYAFLVECLLFHFRNETRRIDRRLLLFYTGILLIPMLIGSIWILQFSLAPTSYAARDFTLTQRLLTETRVLWDYAHWTLIPNLSELSLYHDDYAISQSLTNPLSTSFAIIGLVGVLAAAVFLRKRRPVAALGIALFLAAHALTATVIPLELVYEHRNYFSSFCLFMALADIVFALMQNATARFAGATLGFAFIVFFSFTTLLRATEWGNPIRFALSESAKHPYSPRARYDEGRTYVVLSDYDKNSPFFLKAKQALIAASTLPNANILPEQALLILASRTNTAIDGNWWRNLQRKLQSRPIGVQETSALSALSRCQIEGHCALDPARMLDTFYAALNASKQRADILTLFANYAVNVLKDYDLGLRLLHGALEKSPGTFQYHENLVRILIFVGKFDEAQSEMVQMARMNHFGTHTSQLARLDERLAGAKARQHQRLQ